MSKVSTRSLPFPKLIENSSSKIFVLMISNVSSNTIAMRRRSFFCLNSLMGMLSKRCWCIIDMENAQMNDRKILRSRTNPDFKEETHKLNGITICISSQVGCAVGCIFVSQENYDLRKISHDNRLSDRSCLQIVLSSKKFGKKVDGTWNKVRNVVFMGMGEPLLNYDNMKRSIECMLDQQSLGLSKRHVTISSSGVVRYIDELVADGIDVRLAIEFARPNQPLRENSSPMIAKKRPLEDLMNSIDNHVMATDNRVFYEYIMIKDTTDTPEIAHQLGELLADQCSSISSHITKILPCRIYQRASLKWLWNLSRSSNTSSPSQSEIPSEETSKALVDSSVMKRLWRQGWGRWKIMINQSLILNQFPKIS